MGQWIVSRVAPSVFISYRREDCPGHAGRLFDHLRARFGGGQVFMDVTDIEAGVDFTDVLQRAVGSCDVLLAVVGREWLTCTDRNGRRRLDDPNDFIRLEIGIALNRNVRVIPVLVEGAVMPTASELPPDLERFTKRQAIELRDARWSADVDNLAEMLDRVIGPAAVAIESGAQRRRPGQATFWGLAAIAFVAVLAAVVTFAPRTGSPPPDTSQSVSNAPAITERREPVETQAAAPVPRAPVQTQRGVSAPTVPAKRDVRTDAAPPAPPRSSRPTNAFLGLTMANPVADSRGVVARGAVVQSLAPGGPAAEAGLMTGDLVVEYAGNPVGDATAFTHLVGASAPGDTVLIRVRRGGAGRTLEVVVGDRANAPGTLGTVLVHYTAAGEQKTAEVLAAALRETINDPRYTVRIVRSSREIIEDGEVHYSATGLATLAGTLAQSAASTLTRLYGRRVAFERVVDSRVTRTSVIVVMPRRTVASAPRLPDPVVIVAYASAPDARTAEALANFLRTLRSGWKYSVRTEHMVAPAKAGQIEYTTERLRELAQILAREPAAWISRSYERQIVLQPTQSDTVGADAVVLWLPGK